MVSVRFETVLQRPEGEATATFIEIPVDVRAVFGRARPPVTVTMNGYTYRSTVAVYGEGYFLPVNKVNRAGARVDAGDRVTVELAADDAARTVDVPDDLAEALRNDPDANERFEDLAYTHRLEYVRWVTEAKKAETRSRRIAETISRLRDGLTPRR
ncbi:MAG: YdeI/OmpD-associated family protein [Chloroflexota bacterium]|nr:YdeI/OmpD-associated family protein [Chloroflexota bacterium]